MVPSFAACRGAQRLDSCVSRPVAASALEADREVPCGETVAQLCYIRPMRSENGKARAVLLPVDDDTDLESLLLSQNKRLWELIDRSIAGSGKRRRTRLEDLPE